MVCMKIFKFPCFLFDFSLYGGDHEAIQPVNALFTKVYPWKEHTSRLKWIYKSTTMDGGLWRPKLPDPVRLPSVLLSPNEYSFEKTKWCKATLV